MSSLIGFWIKVADLESARWHSVLLGDVCDDMPCRINASLYRQRADVLCLVQGKHIWDRMSQVSIKSMYREEQNNEATQKGDPGRLRNKIGQKDAAAQRLQNSRP